MILLTSFEVGFRTKWNKICNALRRRAMDSMFSVDTFKFNSIDSSIFNSLVIEVINSSINSLIYDRKCINWKSILANAFKHLKLILN